MSSTVNLKALGLNFSPNSLSLPDGSLTEATNVILRRDNVVESRRGFKLYGNSFGSTDDRTKQLFAYRSRLLRHYAQSLQYDDGSGTFSTFDGTFTETETGLRIKSVESNGNLYFTTGDGIKKISAASGAGLTTAAGYITNAGGVKGIDFTAQAIAPESGTSGFLPQDSAVAYRHLWVNKDANGNLIQGSPSQSVALYVGTLDLLIPNYLQLLNALDLIKPSPATSFFYQGNYFQTYKVTSNDTAETLRDQAVALATAIDNDIVFATDSGTYTEPDTTVVNVPLNISATAGTAPNLVRITFSSGNPSLYFTNDSNKLIYLSGFGVGSSTGTSINGARTVSTVTSTYIEFTVTGVTAADTFSITSGVINSNQYRSIITPIVPSAPPTAADLLEIQSYIEDIMIALQNESSLIIGSSAQTAYITPLEIDTTSNARLEIHIPQDVTTSHFLQIYRSPTTTATGTTVLADLSPVDEMQLVYEAYPTSAELASGYMTIDDVTPDIFKGANLYTNATSGEGILKANDIPPFAKDVNRFKNVVFYANTKTRHRITPFSLLGISRMIEDYDNGITPTITIANEDTSNTYTFVTGEYEVSQITAVADVANSLNGKYWLLNSANDTTEYYVWYKTSGGSESDPAIAGKTGIKVYVDTGSTGTVVAARTRDAIATYAADFTTSAASAVLTITNVDVGYTTDLSVGTSGFTSPTVNTQGRGESLSLKQILLSDSVSPAQAVTETSNSMVRVINANNDEVVYAFYTSGLASVPGKMLLEARGLSDTPFYIIANNSNTGESFSPDISPEVTVSANGAITVANPTQITSAAHGLVNNDQIIITASNSTPSIDGVFTVTVTGANTFTIDVNVTSVPNPAKLSWSKLSNADVSENEVKSNRIYYSKFQQPEAVPIVNYLDIGEEDKEILRIFPLRDSLFVFKEDGLYRISGETEPFYVSLFDSSCILVAADSVSVANNIIYGFTRQGISTITEAGVVTISRPIDTEILKISSNNYPGFSTATWGVGYESDNSYIVWTVSDTADDSATIAYRYSNLTNSWTTFDKENTCGLVNPADDKLYLGAGDTNYIEQERKTFSRLDYADRELTTEIGDDRVNGLTIRLPAVSEYAVGDVFVQTQYLTPYKYNNLLHKLDMDPGVASVDITGISQAGKTLTITAINHNLSTTGSYVTIQNNTSSPSINDTYAATYVDADTFQITTRLPVKTLLIDGQARLDYNETLRSGSGDNLRDKLEELAAKLDTDPGCALTDYESIIDTKSGTITAIAVGTSATITTSSAHGLKNGRLVTITGSDSSPSINGSHVVTVTGANTFTIPVTVVTAGTTGSFATDDSSFTDIQACFNAIVTNLNTDSGVAFSNYSESSNPTVLEAIITDINKVTKVITLNLALDWVVGPATVYKAIASSFTYAPNTMGDPLSLKHAYEATVMFENKAFTSASLSFATDLLPKLIEVEFNGDGNGIFGHSQFGTGYFGGNSHPVPFRTYVPRNCQRCRYIVLKYSHSTAREKYSVYGVTITANVGQSTRAYR